MPNHLIQLRCLASRLTPPCLSESVGFYSDTVSECALTGNTCNRLTDLKQKLQGFQQVPKFSLCMLIILTVGVLYTGLGFPLEKVFKKLAQSHEHRLQNHVNVKAIQFLNNTELVRRLKRTKLFERLCLNVACYNQFHFYLD